MSRRVEIAPGITMASTDLVPGNPLWQIVVEHVAAGPAVISRCTDTKRRPGYFFEIETSFHGAEVKIHTTGPEGHLDTLDDALAMLVLLGARWMYRHQDDSYRSVLEAISHG